MENTKLKPNTVTFRICSGPIMAPRGIVYSTSPECYTDDESHTYVVKGGDINIVVAEAVSYRLALNLSIHAPQYAIGTIPDKEGYYFGSKMMDTAIRDPLPFLFGMNGKNQKLIYQFCAVHAFDVWVANNDRNLGGLLVGKNGDVFSLVAIDFEKSLAIRGPYPLMQTGSMDVRTLQPTGLLKKLKRPWMEKCIEEICSFDDDKIAEAVKDVRDVLGDSFHWSDSVVQILASRRKKLHDIMREVWA